MIEEGIHDGDFVIVLRREQASPGEMVVALVHDEATLEALLPRRRKGKAAARESPHEADLRVGRRCAGPRGRRGVDAEVLNLELPEMARPGLEGRFFCPSGG